MRSSCKYENVQTQRPNQQSSFKNRSGDFVIFWGHFSLVEMHLQQLDLMRWKNSTTTSCHEMSAATTTMMTTMVMMMLVDIDPNLKHPCTVCHSFKAG